MEANESDIQLPLKEKTAVAPTAWKPGVVWDGMEGEITSRTMTSPTPHWDEIIAGWGYDPKVYEIVEPVKISTWDAQTASGTQQLWSYKAGMRVRTHPKAIPYDDLLEEIKKHKPVKPVFTEGPLDMVVCLADWQTGKPDGDGLTGTVQRILAMIDDVENRIKELNKLGRQIGRLFIIGMGDMIEGCDQSYATQTFGVELNRREQVRIARRLVRDAIVRWSKYFGEVIVSAVPGNHGENRSGGRLFTSVGDNDDVAIFEVVAEILASNPKAFGHVSFHIPENEIYVTFRMGENVVGFTHGHITRGSGSPQNKIKSWWEDQVFGEQKIGQANILVTAHYHHFSVIEYGKKIHIQAPTVDGGSEWWQNLTGQDSRQGTLTFLTGGTKIYQDLEVI